MSWRCSSAVRRVRRCRRRGELRGHCSDLRVGAPVSARETESLRPTLLIFNDIAHIHTRPTTLAVMPL